MDFAVAREDSWYEGGWRNPREGLGEGAAIYDWASLTKIVTSTLARVLDREGILDLDSTIGAILPEAHARLSSRTLRDLLSHRSGLKAWAPLYHPEVNSDLEAMARDPFFYGGTKPLYSDLGYLLWGALASRVTGRDLSVLVEKWVLGPLDLGEVSVHPPAKDPVVPSRLDNAQEVELANALGLEVPLEDRGFRGVPQDGNARYVGELCGHAGLFGRASDLCHLGLAWLRGAPHLGLSAMDQELDPHEPFVLGWWRGDLQRQSLPRLEAPSWIHPGFTGGVLWIEPRLDQVTVLLTHRPSKAVPMGVIRREFRDLLQGEHSG